MNVRSGESILPLKGSMDSQNRSHSPETVIGQFHTAGIPQYGSFDKAASQNRWSGYGRVSLSTCRCRCPMWPHCDVMLSVHHHHLAQKEVEPGTTA